MTDRLSTPERLFDRSWRPSHPYAPRLSRRRRWVMLITFIFLSTIIGVYWYITDANRVRALAESTLTTALGGPVKVGHANLSLFEGLRLDDVEVRVDDSNTPDAVIFSAKTFQIQVDPRAMLRGKLVMTGIRAIDPHVRLTENLDTKRWNYQRMVRVNATRPTPSEPMSSMVLPEIILRNAQIDYSEIKDGHMGSLGSMAIEGRLSPGNEPGKYMFDLQSRGESEGIGPVVSGSVVMNSGQVTARMKNFEFGRDIRTMLPAQVRDWWEQHELSGRVDIPLLAYTPARDGKPAAFKVETDLNGVTLAVHPEEWRGSTENRAIATAQRMLGAMRWMSDGGLDATSPPAVAATPVLALDNDASMFDRLAAQFRAVPIKLNKVSGTFVFTEDGIDVKDVAGRVETNGFKISGRIDGYSPDAPARLTIASLDSENIFIPHAPRYVASFPQPVREIYDHLHPEGTCSLLVTIDRPTPGARPEVEGKINILDGQFVFDKFPYPLRQATGTISIAHDKETNADRLEIVDLRGRGVEGGPNADGYVTLNGLVTPLGPDCAVTIRIAAKQITSEPALRDAFPGPVRQALSAFDVKGDGDFPKYHGDFVCDVIRPYGLDQHWTINVDVDLDDASGALVAFPYPLSGVKGRIEIREGHLDLRNLRMKRDDADLAINGKVTWADDDVSRGWDDPRGRHEPRPDIHVTAHNVPLDHTLLAALPADRRGWLEKLGIGGKVDIDGRVLSRGRTPTTAPAMPSLATTLPTTAPSMADLDYDLDVTLREGTIWPIAGTFAIADMSAKMRLTPTSLDLKEVAGKRGDAMLTGGGTISWTETRSKVDLHANVQKLALDAPLYGLLPATAKRSWDQVKPEGTVDADIQYTTTLAPADAATTQPTTAPSLDGLRLTVRPIKLSVTPQVVPYRLDDVTGELTIAPDQVVLKDLAAHHGDAKIKLSGSGQTGETSNWDLKLSGRDLLVDDDLCKAIPETLSGLLQSLKMWGKIDIDFSKLAYRDTEATPVATTAAAATTARSLPHADVDFATRITTHGAGLDVGVPLSDVDGTIDLAGTIRHGAAQELAGKIDIASLKLAGRDAKDFRAELFKPSDRPALQIGKMQAQIAGGEMAGQVGLEFPDNGPSRYAVSLQLRNADVKSLAGEEERDIQGLLNASLDVQGAWGDVSGRRGRGDVTVAGKSMYRMPVVLGLLQITNLSLPISSPFNEGSSRYSLDGNKVTFENIELRSKDMVMQGSGSLDFGTKNVRLTFVTDNPGWPALPFIGDLVKGAKHELLQIHVKGTLQEPKVSASSMNTFTTTVDEVFKGDSKK